MIQLVLLSGGSGKRLWPLSNNARSKQFLPLLQAPDGSMESMVQRVVRQVKESGIECQITIATNASQLGIITNQLGDAIDVVTEPERRDTFPAIALASAYLSLHKKCAPSDVVVIMPCDPFTGIEYFATINKMAQCVALNVAELVLMGIKPTYPSAKYGYVIAQGDAEHGSRKVSRFVEKPNVQKAEALLAQGAYWNGGVFAFKLGYLTNILSKYVVAPTFEQVRSRYGELPKISFDYEVAEKAQSVAVVPFEGYWKDLGTWNTLTEEIHSNTLGNVVLGDNTHNTHVINELSIPIFCEGIDNAIVAACPDGIIVSAKQTAENIKDHINKLADRPMYEERNWGKYAVMGHAHYSDGYGSLTKTLTVDAGKCLSYQIHRHRDEVWTVVDGTGQLMLDDKISDLNRGDVVRISAGQKHSLRAITDLVVIEVQIGDVLQEEDIERIPFTWPEA